MRPPSAGLGQGERERGRRATPLKKKRKEKQEKNHDGGSRFTARPAPSCCCCCCCRLCCVAVLPLLRAGCRSAGSAAPAAAPRARGAGLLGNPPAFVAPPLPPVSPPSPSPLCLLLPSGCLVTGDTDRASFAARPAAARRALSACDSPGPGDEEVVAATPMPSAWRSAPALLGGKTISDGPPLGKAGKRSEMSSGGSLVGAAASFAAAAFSLSCSSSAASRLSSHSAYLPDHTRAETAKGCRVKPAAQ